MRPSSCSGGLVPAWAPDPSIGNRMINARAETPLEKPSFKQLVSRRRCVIPADGFYEWRREGNHKIPLWIHLKNKEPFVFAGLWALWRNPELGDVLSTFTIITTPDRMRFFAQSTTECPLSATQRWAASGWSGASAIRWTSR